MEPPRAGGIHRCEVLEHVEAPEHAAIFGGVRADGSILTAGEHDALNRGQGGCHPAPRTLRPRRKEPLLPTGGGIERPTEPLSNAKYAVVVSRAPENFRFANLHQGGLPEKLAAIVRS